MKLVLRLHAGNIIKISEVIYSDPTEDKLMVVIKEILKSFESLKNKS